MPRIDQNHLHHICGDNEHDPGPDCRDAVPTSEELSLDTSGLGISHSYAERVGLGLAGEPAQFELNKEKLLQMTNMGLRTAPIDIPPPAGWWTQSKQGAQSIDPLGRLVGQMGKMEQAEEGAVHFYKPVDGVFSSSRPAKLGDRQVMMQAYTAENVSAIGKQVSSSPGTTEPYEVGKNNSCGHVSLELYMSQALPATAMFEFLLAHVNAMFMQLRVECLLLFFVNIRRTCTVKTVALQSHPSAA